MSTIDPTTPTVAAADSSTPSYELPEAFVAMLKEQQAPMIAQLTTIVSRLESIKGTAAQRKNLAVAALKAQEGSTVEVLTEAGERDYTGLPFAKLSALETQLEEIKAAVEAAKQDVDGSVRAYLTAKHQDQTVEKDGLVAQYKSLVSLLEASARFGVAPDSIPALPKGSGSSSSSTTTGGSASKVSSKTGIHYVVKNGARKVYSGHEDIGGLAWYVFAKCGTETLTAALKAVGINMLGDEWETELTIGDKTATVGHYHVSPEAPATTPATEEG